MENLRDVIREIIREMMIDEKEELLGEPDQADGREEEEASAGGVAGVSTPLGTGPNYPNKTRRSKKIRSPLSSASSGFGGAKPPKKK